MKKTASRKRIALNAERIRVLTDGLDRVQGGALAGGGGGGGGNPVSQEQTGCLL